MGGELEGDSRSGPGSGAGAELLETIAAGPGAPDRTTPGHGGRPVPSPGTALGRYVVLSQLGAGAMGVVLAAYDPELDRRVAIKLLHGDPAEGDSVGRGRLLREAQALARLAHPNVVAVHDVGVADGRVFIAMEYVRGQTLTQWLRAAASPSAEDVLALLRDAGRGLAAAHARGLVHRDFKPDNVMVGEDGRVRVMDFGLARAAASAGTAATELLASDAADPSDLGATQTGALVGTPAYMAPEQWAGAETDARTDQFAFCVVAFEALFGHRPFKGDSLTALAYAISRGRVTDPPRAAAARVSPRVRHAIQRGLSSDAGARWPSLEDLIAQLEPPRPRGGAWLGAGLGLAGVALTMAWALRPAPAEAPGLCDDAAAAMEATWNPDARARVVAGIQATGVPLAAGTAEQVAATLDEYAAEWVTMMRASCRATRESRSQTENIYDRRSACLDRRRMAVGALVNGLATMDASGLEHALESARELPPIAACGDLAALQAEIEPPPPALRAEVGSVRSHLAEAEAAQALGEHARATQAIEAASAAAQGVSYPPLEAELALVEGSALCSAGRIDPGRARLRQAVLAALEVGDLSTATRAATELAGVTAPLSIRETRDWIALADALATRLDDPVALRLEIDLVRAHADATEGDSDAAAQGHASVVERSEASGLLGGSTWSRAMSGQMWALLNLARYDEAELLAMRRVEVHTARFGADHPTVAGDLIDLASIEWRRGRNDVARERLQQVVRVFDEAYGPAHPRTMRAMDGLAIASSRAGRIEETLEIYRDMETRLADRGSDGDRDLLRLLENRGTSLWFAGRFEEARRDYERAVAIRLRLGDDEPLGLARLRDNLGATHTALGEPELALELHAAAQAIWRARLSARDPTLAISRQDEARALVALKRWTEARAALEEAQTIMLATAGDPVALAEVRLQLVEVLRAQGAPTLEQARLLALAEAAIDDAGRSGERLRPMLARLQDDG